MAEALQQLAAAGRANKQCTLAIGYEELVEDEVRAAARVQSFLGLGSRTAAQPQRRTATPDDLCKLVANGEEVCDAFFGCVYIRLRLADNRNGCYCKRLRTAKDSTSRRYCPILPQAPVKGSGTRSGVS